MRTETRTVRVGELLGPIDWSYDFASHGWDQGGAMNPELLAERVDRLRALERALDGGEEREATTYGGWPRCGWGRVCALGMYDGWPHWKPTPSVLIATHLGAEWCSVFRLSDVRVRRLDPESGQR